MDDLDHINGIGKATAKRLVDAGITTFAALAALSAERAAALDVKADWIAEAARLVGETPTLENTPASDDQDGGGGNPAAPAALDDAAGELDADQLRISVTAAAGPRRRAGFGFGPEARILTLAELGETLEIREATLRALQADPQLSVKPIIEEAPSL